MISENQAALLKLLKASLFGIKPDFPADTDWDAVYDEAAAQTVVALAAPAVPESHAAKWQVPAAQSTAHYMRALFEQTKMISLFEASGIPLVILKGSAAAIYYPRPQLRTMGDIDFLVREDDFEAARALLENNGYAFNGDYLDGRDYTYVKGGVIFELHRRYSDKEYDIEPILINGMKNAVARTVSGQSFKMLPDFENGLLLLDHIRHHLHGGLGIRQIIDWTMFVNAVLDDKSYAEHFLPLITGAGLVTFAETVTKMCKIYLGLPDTVTWCDGAEEATAEILMEKVLTGGNFGRKTPYEYKPMREFTADIKKKGIFKALQHAGMANFSICRKYRFFGAFAWLFQIFRFIPRGIAALFRGENLKKDIKAGNKEADLHIKLGLK